MGSRRSSEINVCPLSSILPHQGGIMGTLTIIHDQHSALGLN
jgi:hypothetical protein